MTDGPTDAPASTAAPPRGMDLVLALLQQVGGLADAVSFERSFRLSQGRLDRDRLLLGIDRPVGIAGLDDAICRVCSAIGMPPDHQRDFRHQLARANHVYFGVERAGAVLTLKGYLEFRDAIAAAPQADAAGAQAVALYTGYKWAAVGDAAQAVSQYLWQPDLSSAGILQRLEQLAAPTPDALPWRWITRCAQQALQRLAPQTLQFVEVREAGQPRCSVDLNVYRLASCIDDERSWLDEAVRHFGLQTADTTGFLARIGRQRVGHVAGGIDRHGHGFLTVYHGGTHVAGRQLQTATLAGLDARRPT